MDIEVSDVDHVALRVTDLAASLAFYRDLLGLSVRDRDRYNADEVPYVAVVAGGRHLHLVPTDPKSLDEDELDVGGEHVCLLVRSDEMDTRDQLEGILETIDEAGYEIEPDEPKKRYGAYGRDWAAYVRDPDGRRVEIKLH
ncbi:VOC family protein [Halopenitus sp. H-Gu1]|uniref:VOC family protein n=1 Tax=Halopenitus sp. H-Gu1 TaxID=3242697 RepID=UPI00359E2765